MPLFGLTREILRLSPIRPLALSKLRVLMGKQEQTKTKANPGLHVTEGERKAKVF